MRGLRCLVVLLLAFLVVPASSDAGHKRHRRRACPADVVAAVAEQCPCDAAPNHGQHVSCVVRYARALRRAGCPDVAPRALFHCAVRSTCGRPDAVVCCTPLGPRLRHDEEACLATGGTPEGTGSACGACDPTRSGSTTSTTETTTTTSTTDTTTTTSTTTSTTTTTLS